MAIGSCSGLNEALSISGDLEAFSVDEEEAGRDLGAATIDSVGGSGRGRDLGAATIDSVGGSGREEDSGAATIGSVGGSNGGD
jgi:hypothetical protein